MSTYTNKLLMLDTISNHRNTVLTFCEPEGTSRDVLFNSLLDGTYTKPFLIEEFERTFGNRLPTSLALKQDLLALKVDGHLPRLRALNA